MNYYSTKKHTGFTLIEMIIAVFIFTVSLTALMAISSRGLRTAKEAQNQVVADYLALEGIEIVRNLRDSALLSLEDVSTWQNVFDQDGCLSQGGGDPSCMFTLDDPIVLEPCSTCTVYYSESAHAYRHDQPPGYGYKDSGFTRKIKFTTATGNDSEIVVKVVVTRNGGEVEYTDNLFLWL